MRALYVEWVDSCSNTGRVWKSRENTKRDVAKCVTLGFIVEENDRFITIASSTDPDHEDYAGEMTIPKAAITKRRRVKL